MKVLTLMRRGDIVDIRWGELSDRRWLREHAPRRFLAELPTLIELVGPDFSVYRCSECGEFGAFEGIGDGVLLVWSLKGKRCTDCCTGVGVT